MVPLEQMVMSTSHVTELVFLEMWMLGLKYYQEHQNLPMRENSPLSRLILAINALVLVENGCYLYLLSACSNFWATTCDARGHSGS